MLYFAYGSNLDRERMKERKCDFSSAKSAHLKDWKLVFNKRSAKIPAMGFGNVIPAKGEIVEGILYEMDDSMIKSLDKYEGYPKHYNREKIIVSVEGKEVEADIYIATPEWTDENVKPTQDYIDHFLAGKEFLSEKYYNFVKNTSLLSL